MAPSPEGAGSGKESPYPKAELAMRLLARAADLLVAGLFAWLVPVAGALAGVFYLLLADALPGGQSPGKRLLGIKVVHVPSRRACGPAQAVLRSIPVALAFALAMNLFLAVIALPILVVEGVLVLRDARGLRFGDVLADTQVIDGKVPFLPGEVGYVRPRLPTEVGAADARL